MARGTTAGAGDAAPAADRLTKGQRTRLRLLEAAEEIFGRRGFYDTSVVEITQAAEVAQGTFYLYFPSKTALLVELVRTRGHELRQRLHEATSELHGRAAVERAGFEAFLAWVRDHPAIYRIVRQTEFIDRDVFEDWYRKLAEEYARGLRTAAAAGEAEVGDVEATVYCLMGMGDFIGMRFALWDGDVPVSAVDTLMTFVERGLGLDRIGRR